MRRPHALLAAALLALPATGAAQDAAPPAEPPPAAPAPAAADDAAGTPKLLEEPTPEQKAHLERLIDAAAPDADTAHKVREGFGLVTSPDAIGPEGADPGLLRAAGRFFFGLKRGDAATVADLCHAPFRLESETLSEAAEVKRRLGKLLEPRPLAALPLYGVEVLPAAQMTAKHGAPPARLGEVALDGAWVAIANFGGAPFVAVFRKEGRGWKAVALTD